MRINVLTGPFLPVPPARGGALEKVQFALAGEYVRAGHSVTLVSRRYADWPAEETIDGLRLLRVPSGDQPAGRLAALALDVAYVLRARRAIPAADVTVTNSVSAPLLLPRRAGLLHVSVGRFPKRQMGLYRRAARLLAPSSAVAAAIARQSPEMKDRVRVIPYPIGAPFAASARAALAGEAGPERDREVVFVGRIAREKGVHLLIDAFRRIAAAFPAWRLSIIGPAAAADGGDGEAYLAALREAAAPLGERVRFDGPIYDPDRLIDRLRRAGLFVYPSLAERGETFGVAPVEAMACACPVVVSDLACFRQFLQPGRNGVAFDHRADPAAALAAACAALMEVAATRDRLGRAGLETSRGFFPEVVAEAMLQDFRRLLADRPDAAP